MCENALNEKTDMIKGKTKAKALRAEWIGGANSSASSGLGEFACGVLRA
jgi:hypothetical protein